MDAARFEALLDQLQALGGLRDVLLSGQGEPFLHPAIATLMGAVKRRGLSLTVMTNLVAPQAEPELVGLADAALVSIHGASERSYLDLHPGFTADHHALLRARLHALRGRSVRVKHVQVITRHNAMDICSMVRLAFDTCASRITFKLASLRRGTEPCSIQSDQRSWLLSEGVPAAAALASELGVPTNLDVLALQLQAGGTRTSNPAQVPCSMGYVYARVQADETVLYCCNTNLRMGSLREAAFAELWWGERWQALRDRLRAGDYPAGCEQCGKIEQNVKFASKLAALGSAAPCSSEPGQTGAP